MQRGWFTGLGLVMTLGFFAVGSAITGLTGFGTLFSPGALNAQVLAGTTYGAVPSHAALGANCAACHAGPWAAQQMNARCLACHEEVQAEFSSKTGLHVSFADPQNCRTCHTEHHGADASLTVMDLANFPHDKTGFPLTGKHAEVSCTQCHQNNQFKNTARDCASCHKEPASHLGVFDGDCAACHGTSAWQPAQLQNHTFPLNHGGATGCVVCHPNNQYKAYTCYGCHADTQANEQARHTRRGIQDITDCVKCHGTGGRGEGGRRG